MHPLPFDCSPDTFLPIASDIDTTRNAELATVTSQSLRPARYIASPMSTIEPKKSRRCGTRTPGRAGERNSTGRTYSTAMISATTARQTAGPLHHRHARASPRGSPRSLTARDAGGYILGAAMRARVSSSSVESVMNCSPPASCLGSPEMTPQSSPVLKIALPP